MAVPFDWCSSAQRARGAHGVWQAAAELADSGEHPAIGEVAGQAMQFPGRFIDNHGGGGVADIEVAGAVLLAEAGGVEDIAAGYRGGLVGIPVHGVRVGVVSVQGEAAAAVAGDFDHGRFISGVGAAHDLGDLLVARIGAAESAGGGGPGGVKGNRDLGGFDGAEAGGVDDAVGDGLGAGEGRKIGVDGDGQAAAEAGQRGGGDEEVSGQSFFN
jgi:hypothetical protein